jgi:putative flippase GtrA
MSRSRSAWVRWLRFNAVGAMGIVVQLATLAALKSGFGMNYVLATAFAVEAAVLHNFFWHERYTWADRRGSRWPRLAAFNVTTGGFSIVGNVLATTFFVQAAGLNYFVANLLSIAVCSVLNFLVADRFVFVKVSKPTRIETLH